MNESGLESLERLWEESGMDLKAYLDKCQEMLKNDPEYTKWLIELSEETDEQS